MDVSVDAFLQARPALDGLLKTLFAMFLISGVACEIYVHYVPVCLNPFYFM